VTGVQSQSHADRVYDWWSEHPLVFEAFLQTAFMGRYRQLRRESVVGLDLDPDDRVLDLACGSGPNFERLAPASPDGGVVGLDHSPGMVRSARDRALDEEFGNVDVVRGDAAALPFPDDTFDAALCTLSLSAIPDHEAAITEVGRVVRAGGRFVVFDAQPYQSGPGRLLNPIINRISAVATNWYPERHLPTDLRDVFGADAVDVDLYNGGTAFVATVSV
jgi:demethylmenaquinone methyltransferase/2-methoxy-6-polyprenyl-1,4-benzoquinol methylase